MNRLGTQYRFFSVYGLLLTVVLSGATQTRGAVFTDASPSPDFTLTATDGSTFRLQDRTGRVVLLYFGYTHCPDVCSRTMAILKSALDQMQPRERAAIDVVFISLDPERDSGIHLARFLKQFDPGFIGLIPTAAQLEVLMNDYNLLSKKLVDADKHNYSMIHTDLVFAVDRAGILRLAFLTGTTAAVIARDVRSLLESPAGEVRTTP